jgi:hypothetical protein
VRNPSNRNHRTSTKCASISYSIQLGVLRQTILEGSKYPLQPGSAVASSATIVQESSVTYLESASVGDGYLISTTIGLLWPNPVSTPIF